MPPVAIRLPYGMQAGVLTHVSDVASGLACGCLCPACGEPLVAKKGQFKQHHFAHAADGDCSTAVETALHLAAKSILESRREVVLPAVEAKFAGTRRTIVLAPELSYVVEKVELERSVGAIVPDVLAWISGRKVAIEVRVTHAVDERKIERLRELGLSTVEIDLSRAARDLSMAALEPLVVGGGSHKKWVYNAAAERRRNAVLATGRTLRTVNRGLALHVDGCPINARVFKGQAYANVVDDCIGCEHAIEIGVNMRTVTCGGFNGASSASTPNLSPAWLKR